MLQSVPHGIKMEEEEEEGREEGSGNSNENGGEGSRNPGMDRKSCKTAWSHIESHHFLESIIHPNYNA